MRERKRFAKRFAVLFAAAGLALSLMSCRGDKNQEESLEAGSYHVFYLNASMTKLVPQIYQTESEDTPLLIQELMDQFLHVPKDVDCQAALTDKVTYQGYKQEDMVLYLYFDNNYTTMKPEREILCRAALTKTMTQIPGVDYVNIYCGEQPLMDRSGNPVGMLTASDFIENTSDVNSYEKTELTLYFADPSGNLLAPEKQEVVHNINTSMEKLIVEQLIEGPQQEGYKATLPQDTKVLSISVNDNVCYINFDTAFLDKAPTDVKEYIPVYSIVNSLAEMPSVSKVQISVNGSQDVMLRDLVSLNTLFEKNADYIAGGDPDQ